MKKRNSQTACIKIATLLLLFLLSPAPARPAPAADPPPPPDPEVHLGTQLFFDPRLSLENDISCASCHQPERAFTDGLPHAVAGGGRTMDRNTPTLLNVVKLSAFYWDGRATKLGDLILSEIGNPQAMNQDAAALERELSGIPGYARQFRAVYGTAPTSRTTARAIAAFIRTLYTKPAPIDRFLVGDTRAISLTAQRGMELFQGKARCAFCHKGFDFTDSEFHNIGVPATPDFSNTTFFGLRKIQPPRDSDEGRFAVTGRQEDRGSFKTPTLRNITQTGPYMHNGVFKTLKEVMIFYNEGGVRNANLDMEMKPLKLSALEISDIIEFMKTLRGELPKIEKPELP